MARMPSALSSVLWQVSWLSDKSEINTRVFESKLTKTNISNYASIGYSRCLSIHYICLEMTQRTTYPKAHWSPEADYSSTSFFIRRMDTSGYVKPAEAPQARIPLIGFIYVTSGEVLVEVDGVPFLCQPGQILLIPHQSPFAIRFYRNAVGYTGGFAPSILSGTKPL